MSAATSASASHILSLEEALAHTGVDKVRSVRQLENENARLKRLVADLTLDKHALAVALRRKG